MTDQIKGVLLLGGGGHCRSVLDALERMLPGVRIGVVDRAGIVVGPELPRVGNDDDLAELHAAGYTHAIVTVGSVGDTSLRRTLAQRIQEHHFLPLTVIDPSAVISPRAIIGHGVFIGKGTLVNAGAVIGDYAILNTGCIVEHDVHVGAFSHIAPGAVVCGGVSIASDVHIGARSVVIQQIEIGEDALVGAGSVVLRHIPGRCIAFGNPCKVRSKR